MKKILTIVLLSVVLLSVVIVPSFAITSIEDIEQQVGITSYAVLDLNKAVDFTNIPYGENTYGPNYSYFLSNGLFFMVQGNLSFSLDDENDNFGILKYDFYISVYDLNDLSTLLYEFFVLNNYLYSLSETQDVNNIPVYSNVEKNIQLSYQRVSESYENFELIIPFYLFETLCTHYMVSSLSEGILNNSFLLFMSKNTTIFETNSIFVVEGPSIVIEETGNVFTSVISWAGTFVNTVFNNTGLLILFLLGVGISIVLVVIRILRKVMWSN